MSEPTVTNELKRFIVTVTEIRSTPIIAKDRDEAISKAMRLGPQNFVNQPIPEVDAVEE